MKCQQQERKSVVLFSLVQVGIFKRPNGDSKLNYSSAWAALPKRRVKGSSRRMNWNIDEAYAFNRNSPSYSLRRAPTICITRASLSSRTSSACNSTQTTPDTSPDVLLLQTPSLSPLPWFLENTWHPRLCVQTQTRCSTSRIPLLLLLLPRYAQLHNCIYTFLTLTFCPPSPGFPAPNPPPPPPPPLSELSLHLCN